MAISLKTFGGNRQQVGFSKAAPLENAIVKIYRSKTEGSVDTYSELESAFLLIFGYDLLFS